MTLVAEYLAVAMNFARLAAEEKNEDLKLSLLQQAAIYRSLAEERAKEFGEPLDKRKPPTSGGLAGADAKPG